MADRFFVRLNESNVVVEGPVKIKDNQNPPLGWTETPRPYGKGWSLVNGEWTPPASTPAPPAPPNTPKQDVLDALTLVSQWVQQQPNN